MSFLPPLDNNWPVRRSPSRIRRDRTLRRRSDRLESAMIALLVSAFVIAGPLAGIAAGRWADARALAQVRADQSLRLVPVTLAAGGRQRLIAFSPTWISLLLFVPAGSEGDITLTNSGSGTIDAVIQLVGWSTASALVPASQQAGVISAAESNGATADQASLAIYSTAVAQATIGSVQASGPATNDTAEPANFSEDPTTTPDTPTATASTGTDTGSFTSPGDAVSYATGAFATYAAASGCNKEREASTVVRGYDALDQLMWTTTFHLVWCDQTPENTKLDITKMLAVNVEPATTFLGGLAWSYGGVKASSDYYMDAYPPGHSRSGHHSFRDVEWNLINSHVGQHSYISMNMNAYATGTSGFWRGADSTWH